MSSSEASPRRRYSLPAASTPTIHTPRPSADGITLEDVQVLIDPSLAATTPPATRLTPASLNTATCESSSETVTALPTSVPSPFHESDRKCNSCAPSPVITCLAPGDEQDAAANAAKIARRVAETDI